MAEWFNEIVNFCFLMLVLFVWSGKVLWRMAGNSQAGQIGQQATKAAGKHIVGAILRKLIS